jgi:aspartate/methionine/tyrosine aminotransferase
MSDVRVPFVPPAYPYDRLVPVAELAAESHDVAIDLSVGTPIDPPAESVIAALCASADNARRYPPSTGSAALLEAFGEYFDRRFGVAIGPSQIGATIGSKEFVAGLALALRLRSPERDTVLYPAVSYPSYAMGAVLAGCRAVAVPATADFELDIGAISEEDRGRALCLWVNSPANPAGVTEDLQRLAEWGRSNGVLVASDECYAEFTWDWATEQESGAGGAADTILRYGRHGVLAVHSLSKRSNLAGVRVGCYAGDDEVVGYLREVRKHQGLMVPGPAQAAAIVALADQAAVDEQARRYRTRLQTLSAAIEATGIHAPLPQGAFYLWCSATSGSADGWDLARHLARTLGIVTSPGEFYGDSASDHVRVAAVGTDDQCNEVLRRSRAAASGS